jgi:CRISPR-associated protein Cmr6
LDERSVVCREARTLGRLAINLGAESVLETSIALHHTYGTPYIPGSALKGLAAHYAMNHLDVTDWGTDSRAFQILFGDMTSAGYVTFYDALYVPGSGHQGKGLWPDVITVHHPEYYQSGKTPPADWDSPTPIPFLTATGSFLIALSGPRTWVDKAFEILTLALEGEGIGAKTSSGYGRMQFGERDAAESETYAQKKHRMLKETPAQGRLRGTVAEVRDAGRFAFINPAGGGARMFVHISQVKDGVKLLRVDQVVEYRIGKYQGKDQAQDVTILLEPEN